MSDRITASVLVELTGADADSTGHLSAQVDDRADGLNAGRTQFYRNPPAGMEPGFLIWHSVEPTVEAVGGTVIPEGSTNTTHEKDVAEYAQPAQTEIEIELDVPARGVPTLTLDYGTWTLEAGSEYADGTIKSVWLRRTDATSGSWAVGKLEWTGSASTYRIIPASDADYVMLLVSGAAA